MLKEEANSRMTQLANSFQVRLAGLEQLFQAGPCLSLSLSVCVVTMTLSLIKLTLFHISVLNETIYPSLYFYFFSRIYIYIGLRRFLGALEDHPFVTNNRGGGPNGPGTQHSNTSSSRPGSPTKASSQDKQNSNNKRASSSHNDTNYHDLRFLKFRLDFNEYYANAEKNKKVRYISELFLFLLSRSIFLCVI